MNAFCGSDTNQSIVTQKTPLKSMYIKKDFMKMPAR